MLRLRVKTSLFILISLLVVEVTTTGGVSYVRWGRTKCQGEASVLYRGMENRFERK